MDLVFPDKKEAFARLVSGLDSTTELGPSVELLATNYPPFEIIRRIDEDAAYLDKLSRILKARRNDFAPIFSLPLEVMGSIIELCARIEPLQVGPVGPMHAIRVRKAHKPSAHDKLGWVKLGHICQRLRNVVLGMPALWASIAFSLPKGHEEILARAQSAPLTIKLIHPPSPDIPQITISHLLFAKRVELDLRVPEVGAIWSSLGGSGVFTTKTFSVLEDLSAASDRLYENITTSSIDTAPMRAPRLRHLKLENYFIPCNYSSLETFELDFGSKVPLPVGINHMTGLRKLFGGGALREVLSRCTNLRRLALCGPQFGVLPAPSVERSAISLPALKHLCLRTPLSFSRSVWSNIIIRPETQIEVRLYDNNAAFEGNADASAADESAFISALLTRLGGPSVPDVIGVRLECRLNIETRLVLAVKKPGALTIERQGPLAEDCEFILDVRVGRHSRDRTLDAPALFVQLLQDLPKYVDLAEVETLALQLPRVQGHTVVQWCTNLAPYMPVRNIVLEEFPVQHSLWSALCPAHNSGASPALPNAVALFVLPERFMIKGIPGVDLPPGEQLAHWDDILTGFRSRAVHGAGIQRIVFGTFAEVESEQLDELKTVLPEVVDHTSSRQEAEIDIYDPGYDFF